jgi:dTDP-4-dehydrorhamnose reductase
VTGASGQLGQALVRLCPAETIACTRAELNLLHAERIAPVVEAYRPDVVVNCAAYTLVDKAETEQDACRAINADAVTKLSEACERLGSILVQISTDYVFGGRSPAGRLWRESDPTAPQGVYARSKLAGEEAARLCPRHFVVRTCGLYGGGPSHMSFVEKMLELAVQRKHLRIVNDQHCTPSMVDDIARAIRFLLSSVEFGTYHIVNGGSTTWYDFAAELFRLAQLDVEMEPISTAQFGAPAPRPADSVLDTAKYGKLGGPLLRQWPEALADYLLNLRPARLG